MNKGRWIMLILPVVSLLLTGCAVHVTLEIPSWAAVIAAPTATPAPHPTIDWTKQHEERTYTPFGTCKGHLIGVYITNQGAAGKVTVIAHREYTDKTYSEVFRMDRGETVMAQLEVGCFGMGAVRWTVRPTQPGDTSDGVIIIER